MIARTISPKITRATLGRMSYYGDWKDNFTNDQSTYRQHAESGYTKPDMSNLGVKLRDIDWEFDTLPVFEKNFYIEHPHVARRSEGNAERWRADKNIHVVGRGVPKVRTVTIVVSSIHLIFYL